MAKRVDMTERTPAAPARRLGKMVFLMLAVRIVMDVVGQRRGPKER
jgi:hypothetical protein